MALSHFTKVFAIKEAKILRLTADPAGGAATYGASVKLVGAKKLTIAGTIKTAMLRGDNQLLDADAVLDSLTAAIDHAKLSLDALAVLFSTAVVDSGSTPNQLATWSMLSTDTLQYFQLVARCVAADQPASGAASDLLVTLWKCKLSALPSLGLMEEDYQIFNKPMTVVPRLSDNKWMDLAIRETAAAIP